MAATYKNAIMTQNPCYQQEGDRSKTKGLMLHSVGCAQPSAEAFIKNWNSPKYTRACVHGFIDANTGVIYQTLPWNHIGWHGGKPEANLYYIGVEMCESSYIKYTGGASFEILNKTKAKADCKRAYNAAVELFAMLCEKFELNPLTQIVSHNEGRQKGIASAHYDPEHYWQGLGMTYTMDGFRKAVKKKMGAANKSFDPYMVKVTTVLNIRKGPGAEYDAWSIKGQAPIIDKGTYTIVAEKQSADGGTWGLLKSFEKNKDGWINLYYTKRV